MDVALFYQHVDALSLNFDYPDDRMDAAMDPGAWTSRKLQSLAGMLANSSRLSHLASTGQ